MIARKKDESVRFCFSYSRLSIITVRDAYRTARMDEYINSLCQTHMFLTFDSNSGYWQIEIAECNLNKTTFTSHHALYRFISVPFGLKDAPSTFQRAVDLILSTTKWHFAFVYIENIVVFSKLVSDRPSQVCSVRELLFSTGVSLQMKNVSPSTIDSTTYSMLCNKDIITLHSGQGYQCH